MRNHVLLRGLVGVAILIWVSYLAVALAGCAATAVACKAPAPDVTVMKVAPATPVPSGGATRTRVAQIDAAVLFQSQCTSEIWTGSGVMVSPTEILTASHVTHHKNAVSGEDECPHGATMAVRRLGGTIVIQAELERDLPDSDIALVRLVAGAHLDVVPPILGPPPRVGERVCFAAASPEPLVSCGEVIDRGIDPRAGLGHSATTIPGNSGSGIYDATGRLVAIVTWHSDQPNIPETVYVGGRGSILDGSGVWP